MAIIASYLPDESYGLLGPQMAATIIQEHTPYQCLVIAVTRQYDRMTLKKSLADYFGRERPVIGFSTLSGRADLFALAKEFKEEGALTILAGPQADVDYHGEVAWEKQEHRFKGLSENFSVALHGPAEQVIPLLKDLDLREKGEVPGLHLKGKNGKTVQNQAKGWDQRFLRRVCWDNLYQVEGTGLQALKITTGQVLQQIGCPHAAETRWVEIDYPTSLAGRQERKVRVHLRGCSFCDVAADKGFCGLLEMESVLGQIRCLPETHDNRKIPFELINENVLPSLLPLLTACEQEKIRLSQINLTLRADWFIRGEGRLREALGLADSLGIKILLASIGLESFDDTLLRNLNKGLSLETNLRAIRLMRRLKQEFPEPWAYSRTDGAIHGFIHPTPWDTEGTWANIQRVIDQYALPSDILPRHSIPLIIHHASGLGDWIRELEMREGCRYKRSGTIIEWWEEGLD